MKAAYQKLSHSHVVVFGTGADDAAALADASNWAKSTAGLEIAEITDDACELVDEQGGDCGLFLEDGTLYAPIRRHPQCPKEGDNPTVTRIIDSTHASVNGRIMLIAGCANSGSLPYCVTCIRADDRLSIRHPFSRVDCQLAAYIPITTERPK